MELLFGTHVREHGYRIGRLAGLEVERRTHEVRKIFFSANGQMGPQTETRPLAAVPVDHFTGDIALSAFPRSTDLPTTEPLLLSRATRLVRGGHPLGSLSGVEVSPDSGAVTTVVGRQHWWARRLHLEGPFDFSTAGEVRIAATSPRAA
jgi:hypothetical protein